MPIPLKKYNNNGSFSHQGVIENGSEDLSNTMPP